MTTFTINQSNDGTVHCANVHIPGCGNNHVPNGSSLAIEIGGGSVKLLVYGDINNKMPTHEIDLSGALEKNRARVETKAEEAA